MNQNSESKDLVLSYTGREDGYEINFQEKPVAVLRMRRRPLEGPEALRETERADLASGQASTGAWIFQSRDLDKGIQILDAALGTEVAHFAPVRTAGKTLGELRFSDGRNFNWSILEAEPNQISAITTPDGDALLKFATSNNIDQGTIEIGDPALVDAPYFPVLLLCTLYLYMRPVPGVKAAAPSR